jgi:hypothetical protein
MRPFLILLAALIAVVATQARASIQPDIICVDPDIEFPVACDEED